MSKINIISELNLRDRLSNNKFNLRENYSKTKMSIDDKKKLAKALVENASNESIYNMICDKNELDLSYDKINKVSDALIEKYITEDNIGSLLTEDMHLSKPKSNVRYYALYEHIMTESDDKIHIIDVCTARNDFEAAKRFSIKEDCSKSNIYLSEISEDDWDSYFVNHTLDEGRIWDAVKSGAKSIGSALKNTAKDVAAAALVNAQDTKTAISKKTDHIKQSINNVADDIKNRAALIKDNEKSAKEKINQKNTKTNTSSYEDIVKKYPKLSKISAELDKLDSDDKDEINALIATLQSKIENKNESLTEDNGEQSYKIIYTTSKIVRASNPSAAVMSVKKEHENATNVHVDMSYKPDTENESLIESLSAEQLNDFGFAANIMDAINDEYEAVNKYNALLISFKESSLDDKIAVIEDIIKEEYTHIGQLQTILNSFSDSSESIKEGEEEAIEQIDLVNNESTYINYDTAHLNNEQPIDDSTVDFSVDDDFGEDSGFEAFLNI